MRLLLARFRSGAEFLARHLDDRPCGGLFLPTRRIVEPGEQVLVDVRLAELRDTSSYAARWSSGSAAAGTRTCAPVSTSSFSPPRSAGATTCSRSLAGKQ